LRTLPVFSHALSVSPCEARGHAKMANNIKDIELIFIGIIGGIIFINCTDIYIEKIEFKMGEEERW
jgi:hypothetical protein